MALRCPCATRRGAAGATSPTHVPDTPVGARHPAAAPVGEPARRLRLHVRRRGRRRSTRQRLYLEEHGLPLHGLRASGLRTGSVVRERDGASSPAATSPTSPAFPFDHRSSVAAELSRRTLTLTTTLTAGDAARAGRVRLPPVLPAARRPARRVGDHAAGRRAARRSTSGSSRPASAHPPATSTARSAPHVRRRLHVDAARPVRRWRAAAAGSRSRSSGLPVRAGLRAARSPTSICFEPMTAPADALRHSPGAVAPGESFTRDVSV